MTIHDLKLDIKFFDEAKSGEKNFALRKNDRDYHVNDILKKHAWDSERQSYVLQNPNSKKEWQTMRLDEEGKSVPVTAEYSSTIIQKVKEVITAEQLNQCDWDDSTLKAMQNIDWPHVMEVLVDYFDIDQIPVDYVLMEVEVIKIKL